MSSTIFTEEGWSAYLYWQEQDKISVITCRGHYDE